MITITKPTYKCEHCRKMYQVKGACEKHEKACSKNPINDRPCFDCDHCEKVTVSHIFDTFQGEGKEFVSVLKCKEKNIFLVPPKAEHRGNYYEGESLGDGELPNESMPKQCDKRKNGICEHFDF